MDSVAILASVPLISLTVFIPLIGIFVLLFIPRHRSNDARLISFFFSLIVLFLGLFLFILYQRDPTSGIYLPLQEAAIKWIPFLNAEYRVQIDGLNVLMVLMTTILVPLVFLASWKTITFRVKEFCMALLAVETGMLGAFVAQDLLLFFLFWEIMLVPVLFLIGVWGHKDRFPATMKFLLVTLLGSLIMLFAIIYMYIDARTFNFEELYKFYQAEGKAGSSKIYWLFGAFMVAFAIKLPMVPLHGWLPQAYKNAPISGNVILAAIMAKVGAYGIIRIPIPMFSQAASDMAIVFLILGVIAIIWGAFMAYTQADLKQLIAYSSVSHLGFVTVGLFSVYLAGGGQHLIFEGVQGAVYHMFNHGICIAGLFILLGYLHSRGETYHWYAYGGLAQSMPRFAAFFMIIMLASIGLPGLNSFVGELLILFGSFKAMPVIGILAATGMILSAAYMLLAYQRVFFGPITFNKLKSFPDLNAREIWALIPLVAIMIIGGFFPTVFLDKLTLTLQTLLESYHAGIAP